MRFSWTNSMGSSMVTKCIFRVWFISWMMAARVVDLPEPVGPVTSTKPPVSATSLRTEAGSLSCSMVMILVGMMRKTAPMPRSCLNTFTRKRARPGTS